LYVEFEFLLLNKSSLNRTISATYKFSEKYSHIFVNWYCIDLWWHWNETIFFALKIEMFHLFISVLLNAIKISTNLLISKRHNLIKTCKVMYVTLCVVNKCVIYRTWFLSKQNVRNAWKCILDDSELILVQVILKNIVDYQKFWLLQIIVYRPKFIFLFGILFYSRNS
jgi:hypothetical protein